MAANITELFEFCKFCGQNLEIFCVNHTFVANL